MNISDIDEVASRKKINENAGKIREKVNRENAKIIKMKVINLRNIAYLYKGTTNFVYHVHKTLK